MTAHCEKSAHEYGKAAFHRGIKCAPACDRDYLANMITGLKLGEGKRLHKAWLKGWMAENLKAPLTR